MGAERKLRCVAETDRGVLPLTILNPRSDPYERTFYVYMWIRDDGTPYYVGKGSGRRAYRARRRGIKPPANRENIVIETCESEVAAFAREAQLIRQYGRKDIGTGILRNMTDGGDGSRNLSPEARERIGAVRRGKRLPVNHVENMRKSSHVGVPRSEAVRQKISDATMGKKKHMTEETRNRWIAAKRQHQHSKESLEKMSRAAKGRRFTKEHRLHLSEAAFRRYGEG
jgi:NUMOD3 motif-containing protein